MRHWIVRIASKLDVDLAAIGSSVCLPVFSRRHQELEMLSSTTRKLVLCLAFGKGNSSAKHFEFQ